MDFFNSLSQIAKNKNHFKQWEDNQQHEQAQREELYRRHNYSAEELEHAKALGKNIIDVVDIMDNHSESVAENVETALQPIVAGIPFAALLGSMFAYGKFVANPVYKKIHEIKENTIINNENAKKLAQEITEFNKKNGKKYPWFSEYELTSKRSVNKIKNSELKAKAMEFYKKFQKDTASLRRKNKLGVYGTIAAFLTTFIGANIYAAKLQVDSSKIARYQAREALKDPKAFVNYTPEQIERAKQEIADHPELKDKKQKRKIKNRYDFKYY